MNETKFLVKKSETLPNKYNSEVKVLFEGISQKYFINVVTGINKATKEKGFLLLNEFKTNNKDINIEVFKDRLYKTENEAYQSGFYKMQDAVNKDFDKHIKDKKKQLSNLQRFPRKIIRDFINSCNKNEIKSILKNLDNSVIYESRSFRDVINRTEGIVKFEEFLLSSTQDLCYKNITILPSWDFRLPIITIGVKYFPLIVDMKEKAQILMKYKKISFTLNDNKISEIFESPYL